MSENKIIYGGYIRGGVPSARRNNRPSRYMQGTNSRSSLQCSMDDFDMGGVMIGVIRGERTEEAKALRRLYGDKGARFRAKQWYMATDGLSNTITTNVKDNLLMIRHD